MTDRDDLPRLAARRHLYGERDHPTGRDGRRGRRGLREQRRRLHHGRGVERRGLLMYGVCNRWPRDGALLPEGPKHGVDEALLRFRAVILTVVDGLLREDVWVAAAPFF